MGRIRVLPDQVANQIAAGEVVDRPASVVKELLENALDAGADRIRVEVEAGGRKLIRISDDGCGMNRDDALLAFERHATSKLRTANDLLSIATLGFRGEALPSIASVARVTLETATGEGPGRHPPGDCRGQDPPRRRRRPAPRHHHLGRRPVLQHPGAAQIPARRVHRTGARDRAGHPLRPGPSGKALRAGFGQPYAGLGSARGAHGRAHLPDLRQGHPGAALAVAAELPLERAGLPEPPPWKRDPDEPQREPGRLRLTGFYSKPELQKLNRNSIYIFINKRLVRDRLLMHAITEAYRNVIPPTSFPVVLLFLEMPPEEVDVNVHPAKTEVRFRQQSVIHDFVRDSLRTALIKARPAAGFLAALDSAPSASPSLMPPGDCRPCLARRTALRSSPVPDPDAEAFPDSADAEAEPFRLTPQQPPPVPGKLPFSAGERFGRMRFLNQQAWGEAAAALFVPATHPLRRGMFAKSMASARDLRPDAAVAAAQVEAEQAAETLNHLGSLRPLGPAPRIVHPGRGRRRPMDHRPARRPRAGAV